MERAKISGYQLFVLIFLFELGSAMLVPIAIGAKQDAWLAILLGMIGGFCLFYIYYRLYGYYPDMLPTEYMQEILGKFFGKLLAFLYLLYFTYAAARVLRDFGSMLVTTAYRETPMFIIQALLMLVIIYSVRKGIEVLARTGELMIVLILFLAITGFVFLVMSNVINLNNLKPILEEGVQPVLKIVYTQTLYIPFGEAIAFSMILPYVKDVKKAKMVGFLALGASGISLALVMVMNISVLGVGLTTRSQFPLLSTIQSIEIADFLERLDVYFLLILLICGFFKIGLYFYAGVTGIADLFKIKEPSRIVFPIGMVILFLSMLISRSYAEHLQEGLKIYPLFILLPLQVVIPMLLFIIAAIRNRKKGGS